MPYIDGIMPSVGALLESGRTAQENRIGVCVMDDILEHSPVGGAQMAAQCMPVLLASSHHRVRALGLARGPLVGRSSKGRVGVWL